MYVIIFLDIGDIDMTTPPTTRHSCKRSRQEITDFSDDGKLIIIILLCEYVETFLKNKLHIIIILM